MDNTSILFITLYYKGQGRWKEKSGEAVKDTSDVNRMVEAGRRWNKVEVDGITGRSGHEGLGGSDGLRIRSENEGSISFSISTLPTDGPSPSPTSALLWQHLNSGSHQSYLPRINQNLLPLSVRWLGSLSYISLTHTIARTHTHTDTHKCMVRVCNRNQLGFQGCAAGQTGPFITL